MNTFVLSEYKDLNHFLIWFLEAQTVPPLFRDHDQSIISTSSSFPKCACVFSASVTL